MNQMSEKVEFEIKILFMGKIHRKNFIKFQNSQFTYPL